jgi:outer membrane usher protein FimD/PapC
MSPSDVTATATNKGDISVIIIDADGKRVQAQIPIELAEKLKAQIEAALPTARIRANRR